MARGEGWKEKNKMKQNKKKLLYLTKEAVIEYFQNSDLFL